MSFRVRTEFVDRSKLVNRNVKRAMKDAMLDVTLDLKKTATASAPKETGFLEKNAQHEVITSNSYVEGSVGFSAVEDGFNYAEWTHDAEYELGEKSAKKKGGKSKFGSGTVPVGTGYLSKSLSMNRQGYMDYLQERYTDALRRG